MSQTIEDTSAPEPSGPYAEGLPRGTAVGRYIILERLGEGGMGVVYAAFDPELDRKIALKLLHGSVREGERDSRGSLRLVREARAMASLNHPNVASVHDVGTYGQRVFIAMEFVGGGTLSQWLRDKSPEHSEILDIFIRAGRGLAAAHAVGIVHRDFKPDNVLIGEDGRVLVTDFGLATSTGPSSSGPRPRGSGSELARITDRTALLGTPAYMAPEQHLGLPIDARADQFSFSVALYEALYGHRPFEGDNLQALSVAVTSGQMRPAPRGSAVAPWLRRVVMRGLATDATARYPTIAAYLDALARDPAAGRRRWMMRGTMMGSAAVAVGAVAWGARPDPDPCSGGASRFRGIWDAPRRTAVAEAFGTSQRQFAEHAGVKVLEGLDAWANDWKAQYRAACEATHVRGEQSERLLDLRMACLGRQLTGFSALVDELEQPGDRVLEHAVEFVSNLPATDRCRDLRRLEEGTEPPAPEIRDQVDALDGRLARVKALEVAGRFEAGLALATVVVGEAEALGYPPASAEAKLLLGLLQERTGDYEAAEHSLDAAEYLGRAHRNTDVAIAAGVELSYLVGYRRTQPEEGLRWARHTHAEIERVGGDPDKHAQLLNNEASILERQGRYEDALDRFQTALSAWEAIVPASDHRVASVLNNIGLMLIRLGRFEPAHTHLERAVEIYREQMGPDHPLVATALNNLGIAQERRLRYPEAAALYREALAIRERSLGEDHPDVATCLNNLANISNHTGDQDGAVELFGRALEIRQRAFGPDHPRTALVVDNLAVIAREQGRLEEALDLHRRALEAFSKALGDQHPEVATSHENIGKVMAAMKRFDEASASHERALTIRMAALGDEHPAVAQSRVRLGELWARQGRHREALGQFETAHRVLSKATPEDDPVRVSARKGLAAARTELGL